MRKRVCIGVATFVPSTGEINDGPRITDATGYIPAEQQIYNMLTAGQTLQVLRNTYYEDDTGISFGREDEMHIDPTTRKGFSTADADALSRILSDAGDRAERFKNIKARIAATLKEQEQLQIEIDKKNRLFSQDVPPPDESEKDEQVKAST